MTFDATRSAWEAARVPAVAIGSPVVPLIDAVIAACGLPGDPLPYPLWRQGKTAGQIYSIAGTERLFGYQLRAPEDDHSNLINGWQGFAIDPAGRLYLVTCGGHAFYEKNAWGNPILRIDFTQDIPTLTEIDGGSVYADRSLVHDYWDGRIAGIHTYYFPQWFSGAHMPDGIERVARIGGYAGYAQSVPPSWEIQWTATGLTPTYISVSSFSVPGDATATLTVSKSVRLRTSGMSPKYGRILTSVYNGTLTTTTLDSASLGPGLNEVMTANLQAWSRGGECPSFRLDPATWFAHNAAHPVPTAARDTASVGPAGMFNGAVHGWDWPRIIPNVTNLTSAANLIPAICQDYATGTVYVGGNLGASGAFDVRQWKAGDTTWPEVIKRDATHDLSFWGGSTAHGSLFDNKRGKVVAVTVGQGTSTPGVVRIERFTPTPPQSVLEKIILTGAIPFAPGAGFVHDTDSDLYLMYNKTGGASNVGRITSIQPDTGVCTLLHDNVGAIAGSVSNKFAYFESLGCVVLLDQWNAPFRFMPTR